MYEKVIELLDAGGETRNIEFKISYDWGNPQHKAKIVKCILAMSNTKDGGHLVLGIDDNKQGSEKVCGMDFEHYSKMNFDHIIVEVNKFADPPISFQMHSIEKNEMYFVLFCIPEFEEFPIICKRSGEQGLKEGAVYSRSKSKPESAIIRSQSEMRELIDLAINKGIKEFYTRVKDSGLQIADDNSSNKYAVELGDIENQDVIDSIKRGGHWRIIIKPTHYKENRIDSISKCKEKLYNSKLSLRGWDFPHFRDFDSGNGFIQSSENFGQYKELFRFFKSGQFIYYKAMYEEDMDDRYKRKVNGKGLEIFSTLLLFTEIFEFASRLFQQEDMGDKATVLIEGFDLRERKLFFYDPARTLFQDYVSNLEDKAKLVVDVDIVSLISESDKLAIKAINDLFEMFGWDTRAVQGLFNEQQQKLLRGRF